MYFGVASREKPFSGNRKTGNRKQEDRKQENRKQENRKTGKQEAGNRKAILHTAKALFGKVYLKEKGDSKQNSNADILVGTFVLKMVDRN
ncbi:MAG: hypothetical protein L6Q59_06535 [Ignavibacteriaceae bacterium]|nr:hypothetical protein [Ignavibacteriaceae bacterium]